MRSIIEEACIEAAMGSKVTTVQAITTAIELAEKLGNDMVLYHLKRALSDRNVTYHLESALELVLNG